MVARLGGDEFAVLLPSTGGAQASTIARDLLRAFERPFLSDEHALEVSASMGIAVCPIHGTAAETILRRADVAMYLAKKAGGTYVVYSQEEDPYDPDRLALRTDLRRAIDAGLIELYYQPQASLATRAVTGLEALARWKHPLRGWIGPNEFIPIAERMGLIKPLTTQLIDRAAKDAMSWNAKWQIPIAVNVSMRNLVDSHFPDALHEAAAAGRLRAERLKLEITESAVMADPNRVLDTMKRLQADGFRFAIDDFGTGYSSLAYLQRLPVEEIKIDRSFISQLASDTGSASIVRATIELAGSLGLEVVAEGVEDETTWQMLRSMGCSTAQGYYLSRPMPSGDVTAWMEAWSSKAPDLKAA
jgi:predicted signal transduction protein with EAL and GGDEF domain